jgi:hypothetical protein
MAGRVEQARDQKERIKMQKADESPKLGPAVRHPRAIAYAYAALLVLGAAFAVACGSGAQGGPPPAPPPSVPEAADNHDHAPGAAAHEHPLAPPPPADAGASEPTPTRGDATTPADPKAVELAAYERARPVFEKWCATCHKTGAAGATKNGLSHFSMDAYPFGGHHAHEMPATIRKVFGAGGSKPTMPRGNVGAVQGEELSVVLAWAEACETANPKPMKAPHHHH